MSADRFPQFGYIHHSFCLEQAMKRWQQIEPNSTSKLLLTLAVSA
jgi:hypothetical protein